MRDLVMCLILRRTQIELETEIRATSIPAVGNDGTFGVAGDALNDRVLDGSGVGELRLELEVDFADGIGCFEDEVGQCVRGRSARFVGADFEGGGRCEEGRGKEQGDDGGETHFVCWSLIGWVRSTWQVDEEVVMILEGGGPLYTIV